MAEYIERSKAINEIRDTYEYEYPTASGVFDEFVKMLVPRILNNLPTADVVEVVRCKDCEHKKEIPNCQKELYSSSCVACSYHSGLIMDGNDFCSYGERKEGADNA